MKGLFILTVLSLIGVTPSCGRVVCEWYSTYYTYCDPGYSCCYNNEYCCQNSVIIHHVTNEAALSAGVIAAIAISSVVLLILLVIIVKYAYTRCNKSGRAVHGGGVVHVRPGVSTIPTQPYMSQPHGGQGYPRKGYEGQPYGGRNNTQFHGHMEEEYGMPPQYHP